MNPFTDPAKRAGIYYGWRIVGVLFIVEFTSYGISGSAVTVFFFPMAESLHWSLTKLTGAIVAAGIAGMLVSPFIGMIVDRYGARYVLSGGALSAGVALLLMTRVQEIWQYWLLFAIIGALGMGEVGRLSTPVVIAKWFVRKRGRAVAIATSGTMLGGVILAPVLGFLILAFGWRSTWGILGVFVLVTNVLPTLLWVRRQPEDIGLAPDGSPPVPDNSPNCVSSSREGVARSEVSWTLIEAARTRALWLLILSFNLMGFSTAAISFHLIPFFVTRGMSLQGAGYVLSVSLLFSIFARLLWGLLVERYPVQWCLTVMAAFRALGTLILIAVPYPYNLVPFVLFWGLLGGAFGLLQPIAWADYYGRNFQGSIQGSVRPLLAVSRLGAPLIMAILFDSTDSYYLGFMSAAGIAFGAVMLFAVSRPPIHRSVIL